MKIDEIITVNIEYITQDGRGIGYFEDKIILISGIGMTDTSVKAKVVRILEETALAEKVGIGKHAIIEDTEEDVSGDPYEMDGGGEDSDNRDDKTEAEDDEDDGTEGDDEKPED